MAGSTKPILVVIAGPNGSGKTSVTKKLLNHDWVKTCRYINPDEIALELGGFTGENFKKAADTAVEIREECLRKKQSVAFETVFSSPDKLEFMQRALAAGYFIRFFFISTKTPIINAGRITQRYMEQGHEVPISKIVSRFNRSVTQCATAARVADRTYIYDNSVDGRDAQLIFKFKEGVLAKKYVRAPKWASELARWIKQAEVNAAHASA